MPKPVPTFVVDYPEAHAAMERISKRFSTERAGVFPSLGRSPVTADMAPHEVPSTPFVVVNGSGNYHHETVPLVEGFLRARPEGQFAYIQIDAHPDKTERFRWKCECGTFLGRILANPRIDNVHLLGLNLPCLLEKGASELYTRHLAYYGCDYFGKLQQYVAAGSELEEVFWHFEEQDYLHAQANPSVLRAALEERVPPPRRPGLPAALLDTEPEPALVVSWRSLVDFDVASLPNLPVYLSVDLDVSRETPVTDWRERFEQAENRFGVVDNEGVMDFADVLALIRRIGAAREVAAADVCGLTEHLGALSEEAREMSLVALEEVYEALWTAVAGA